MTDDKEELKHEEGQPEEQEESLAFPTAVIVRLIKSQTGNVILKKKVKVAMNKLLEKICLDISKEMAKFPYAYLDYPEFTKAAKPYLKVKLAEQERKKMLAAARKIKEDAATMEAELEFDEEEEL